MYIGALRQQVRGIRRLPVRPDVAADLLARLHSSETFDPAACAACVRRDPCLAAHIFGAGRPKTASTNPFTDAARTLGREGLRALVWPLILPQACTDDAPGPFLQYLWKHSIATALYADRIGRWTESPVKHWAWPAGLLHDLGKFAFHVVGPAQYSQVRDTALSDGRPLIEVEQEVLGASHPLGGKWLAEAWHVPPGLTAAIWFHHHAPRRIAAALGDSALLNLLRLANMLAHAGSGMDKRAATSLAPDDLLEKVGCARDALEEIIPEVEQELARETYDPKHLERLRGVVQRFLESDDAGSAATDRVRLESEVKSLRRDATFRGRLDATDRVEALVAATVEEAANRCGAESAAAVLAPTDEPIYHAGYWTRGRGHALVEMFERGGMLSSQTSQLSSPERSIITSLLNDDHDGHADWITSPLVFRGETLGRIAIPAGATARHARVAEQLDSVAAIAARVIGHRLVEEAARQQAELFAEAALESDTAPASEGAATPLAATPLQALEQPLQSGPDLEALAAGIAQSVHDPLVVITSQAERLLERIDNAEDRRSVRAILDQSFQARRTLNTVLAYARPTNTEPAPALINYVLRRVLAEHIDRLRAKGIRIEERYAEGLPRVRIDRPQFEQAILCLMSNAEDAMARAGGVLGIETRITADRKGVLIRISDTGNGIDASIAKKVFHPFFTTRESGERPGLGLTVAQAVVANHGGQLVLDTECKTGAAFTITLPGAGERSPASSPTGAPDAPFAHAGHDVRPVEAPPTPVQRPEPNAPVSTRLQAAAPPTTERKAAPLMAQRDPAIKPGAAATAHPMVLIVDDDEDLREVLSETLKLGGYEVQTASDGGEALTAIDRDSVQLVLLDMHMPGVNGMQVLENLKARHSALPVIVMSSGASQDEIDTVMEHGAKSYLTKPFQIRQLLAEVAGAVGHGAH